jgi:negative regulator of flagellin synthesis FlgM
MSRIESRPSFFPNKAKNSGVDKARKSALQRNSYDRANEIKDRTGTHAKVDIPDAVRDYSRIKRAVDTAPEVDNSAKIARLKAQIQNGTYNVDYDAVADKILQSEY